MLWVYAASDPHFLPAYAAALHDAFVSGGGQAVFVEIDTHSRRLAHGLLLDRGGSPFWGAPVEVCLESLFGNSAFPGAASSSRRSSAEARPSLPAQSIAGSP